MSRGVRVAVGALSRGVRVAVGALSRVWSLLQYIRLFQDSTTRIGVPKSVNYLSIYRILYRTGQSEGNPGSRLLFFENKEKSTSCFPQVTARKSDVDFRFLSKKRSRLPTAWRLFHLRVSLYSLNLVYTRGVGLAWRLIEARRW